MKLGLSQQNFSTYLGLNFQCNSDDGNYWFTTNTGEVVTSNKGMNQFKSYSVSDGLMNMAMTVYYSKKAGYGLPEVIRVKLRLPGFKTVTGTYPFFPTYIGGSPSMEFVNLGIRPLPFQEVVFQKWETPIFREDLLPVITRMVIGDHIPKDLYLKEFPTSARLRMGNYGFQEVVPMYSMEKPHSKLIFHQNQQTGLMIYVFLRTVRFG